VASFEEQLAELERVVERLEHGGLPLEESVQLFEDGVRLSDACKGQLSAAESRIQVLMAPSERGAVKVEDLVMEVEDDEEEDEERRLGEDEEE
jgi:exodeoxyribonuclease VII small subunit